ncbi:unnamed protein product [Cochlearia groenlandica]
MSGPELQFEKFLGHGSFGSVILLKYKSLRNGKTHYAATKISSERNAESLQREFKILSELKGSPRIIKCYGTKVQEERFNDLEGFDCVEYKFHMEYACGGSLKTFMSRFQDKKLPDPMIRTFTCMILQGLAAVHGRGYVHCDIKPDNILVFPGCELKISDFGLSRREGDYKWWQPRFPFLGTPMYMSPESVSHGETTKGLDLWSLGCVVLEMYTGKDPWWHRSYDEMKKDLKECYEPLIPNNIPFDARIFLGTCFALETEDRKDAETLLKHSFLRGYEVNKMREAPPMHTKKANGLAFELEKIRQQLEEIRSIRI